MVIAAAAAAAVNVVITVVVVASGGLKFIHFRLCPFRTCLGFLGGLHRCNIPTAVVPHWFEVRRK
jgi:hypothetical protein